MADVMKVRFDDIEPVTDPVSGSGTLRIDPQALDLESGLPFVLEVNDPPHKVRPPHSHHADVFYVYLRGEQTIPGEGTFRAGDVRWARGGHVYGPEVAGPEGVTLIVMTSGNPLPVHAEG